MVTACYSSARGFTAGNSRKGLAQMGEEQSRSCLAQPVLELSIWAAYVRDEKRHE
jgi:hypothetical protein